MVTCKMCIQEKKSAQESCHTIHQSKETFKTKIAYSDHCYDASLYFKR